MKKLSIKAGPIPVACRHFKVNILRWNVNRILQNALAIISISLWDFRLHIDIILPLQE